MPRGHAGHARSHRRGQPAASTRSSACSDDDELLRQADARDARARARRRACGWMHGMPQAIKDARRDAGHPRARSARRCSRDHVPDHDALMVERMKAAGCIVIGKTNTPEFGLGSHTFNEVFGVTRNAFDRTQVGRRQQRRRRGRAGDAHAAGRRRQRLHGQPAQPGRLEQRLRLSAEPGPRAALAVGRRLGRAAQHRGADGAHGAATSPRCSTCRPARTRACRCRSPTRSRSRRRVDDFDADSGVRIGWLGDLDGYLAMEPGIARALRARPGAASSRPAAASSRRRSASRPSASGRRWLTWRRWSVAARIAPHLAKPGEPRPHQARGALGIRPGRRGSPACRPMQASGRADARSTARMLALFERFDVLALPTRAGLAVPGRVALAASRSPAGTMDTYHRWMEVVIYATLRRPAVHQRCRSASAPRTACRWACS